MINRNFWRNKKVLVTGHTGFKGFWLSLWLHMNYARVYGLSLKPEKKSLYSLNKKKIFSAESFIDIRNRAKCKIFIDKIKPDIVFHLAAQPIVIDSINQPDFTWQTNINGTINILEICKDIKNVKVVVNITSDKAYKNIDKINKKYKETDALGGRDPYSASKSCADIISQSYIDTYYSNLNKSLIICRAGNVIGGGDYGNYRLIPDIINSIQKQSTLEIRNPKSTRPWQFILDPLYGYLLSAEKAFKKPFSGSFNFSPNSISMNVLDIINIIKEKYDLKIKITKNKFKEAGFLNLSNNKAKKILNWKPLISSKEMIKMTFDVYFSDNKIETMSNQITYYQKKK